MTDDIVTRLRHIGDELQHNDCYFDLYEAADEIERLRADRDLWHDIAHGLATHCAEAGLKIKRLQAENGAVDR